MAEPILITVSRRIAAEPEQVWRAWASSEAVSAWLFRTEGGALVKCQWTPAPGATFEVIEDRAGDMARHFGVFQQVEAPHTLRFTFAPDESEDPAMVTLTFAKDGDGTLLTLTQTMDPQWAEYADRTKAGWTRIVDGAAAQIDRQIVLTRHYKATPQQVWTAWTDPAVLPRWFGPEGFSCTTKEIDLREGGVWRFDMTGMGTVWPNRHRITRYQPHDRIAFLMDDDSDADDPIVVTVDLSPEAGGTRLVQTMTMPSAERKAEAIGYKAVELGNTTLGKLAKVLGE